MRSVLLSSETKAIIARVYLQNPKQKAPAVRLKVWKITHKDNPALPKKWPSLSSIQKELANIRREMSEPSLEDKPWTLDTLRDKPLPPEVLPKVFHIWLTKQENPLSPPLSIREVRWITQLSSMTDDTELLQQIAELCAEWELIGELTNSPQLSPPNMILHIYAWLTRMKEEEWDQHDNAIYREKHPSASGPRHERVMADLEALYGKNILKTVKPKSKKKRGEK